MVDDPNELKLASRIFLSDKSNAKYEYKNALKKYYKSGIGKVNFKKSKEASNYINDWISKQTSGLITSVVGDDQIDSNTKMILTSGIYFKGVWMNPFTSEKTSVRCFYQTSDKCVKSMAMAESGYFNLGYIDRIDAQAIQLPYLVRPVTRNEIRQI